MKKYSLILIVGTSLLLSGCGASIFANRDTNPNIQDMAVTPHFWPWSKNGVNTFATTASRRMVLVNSKDWGKTIISCAEPSPDVGEAFASAVSDALKLAASEPSTGINGTLSNEYARTAMTQITPLIYRTQALQIYRDAVHSHCVDRMNGWYPESDAQIPLDKDEANELTTPTKSTPDIIEIQFNQVTNNTVDPQEKTEGQIRQSFTPVKIQLDPNDYNAVKVFYFQSTVEALKVELPYVLKAQEEFAKNLKTTGISDETVKALVDLTKNLSPTTITSTPTGTSIVTGANVKTESPDNNSEEK